jgi:hypothetical protein
MRYTASIGRATQSAVRSRSFSAIALGTSSPIRDECVRDHERDAVRKQRLVDPPRDERFTDGAEQDREGGDAELNGADEPDRAVHDPDRDSRASVAVGGHLRERGALRGNERVFGRDKERVAHNDQKDRDEL